MTITFGQIKVEPKYAAGALAARGWWVATPEGLGDFILAADLGTVDGGRLFEDQQGRRVVLEVVRFPGEREP